MPYTPTIGTEETRTLSGNTAPVTVEPPLVPATPSRHTRTRHWLWVALAAAALIVAALAWRSRAGTGASGYITARVERGDVTRSITATGTLQAVVTVQVGTQVSGTVSEIHADFNSPVKKGEVIARLDPSQIQAQLTQARANLTGAQMSVQAGQTAVAGAQAAVEAAQANVDRLKSAVDIAKTNYDRTLQLVNEKIGARQDLDTAKATLDQANASYQQGLAQLNQSRMQVASARAQTAQAQAQVSQAQAQVELNSVNLNNTIIRAPIDGVVVARNVDIGQTVAASFNTPTLFQIANDLTRMQVLANIDEADVGQLREGSPASFTVDAFPNETFEGRISQIRLAPQTVQNVVTYTAVIDVANPQGKLRPGMTANVTAIVGRKENVLMIPNAALRFRPAEQAQDQPQQQAKPDRKSGQGTVWRLVNGEANKIEPVRVRLGLTNGTATEVVSGDLHEGDLIVLADQSGGNRPPAANAARSPFSGPPRGGGRR